MPKHGFPTGLGSITMSLLEKPPYGLNGDPITLSHFNNEIKGWLFTEVLPVN